MALNASVLSALIKSKRLAALGSAGVNNAAMTEDCDAIAQAVVEHVLAFAVVSVNVVVASGIPVATAGSPSAQVGATTAPGAGTGTGAIT